MKKMLIAVLVGLMVVAGSGFAFAGNVANSTTQSSAQSSATGVDGDITINMSQPAAPQSIDARKIYDRQLAIPGNTPLPGTNGFFAPPTPDSSFRSMQEIIAIFGDDGSVEFNKGALENMAKGGDVDVHYQVVRDKKQVVRYYNGSMAEYDKFLTVTIKRPKGLRVTALCDAEADDADTNTVQVLGKLGLAALADGNNVLVLTKEGQHRAVEASGWGIGAYGLGSGVNDPGSLAAAGGGGTGYSSNETGPEDRPWLHAFAGTLGQAPAKKPLPDAYSVGNYNHANK